MTPALRTLAAALLGASLVSAAHAQATFGGLTLQSGTIAGPAYDLATIDFDSDGDLDIVYLAGDGANFAQLRFYRNDRNGSLTLAANVSISACISYVDGSRIAVGDVNGDGFDDVVLAGACGVYASLRTAPGVFAPPIVVGSLPGSFSVGNPAVQSVALADVDGDGDLDIAACRASGNAVRIFRKDTGLSWTAQPDVAFTRPLLVRFARLDADNDPDMVVGSQHDGISVLPLRFYENDGAGTFIARTDLGLFGSTSNVHFTDIDGDGDLDLSWAYFSPGSSGPGVFVLRNNGAFSLTTVASFNFPNPQSTPVAAPFADLEGDGDPDLLTGWNAGADLRYSLNSGSGAFGPLTTVTDLGSPIPYAAVALDLDGNSSPDFVMTFGNSGSIRWWLNQTDILPPTAFSLLSPANNTLRLPLPGEPAWGAPAGALSWQRSVAFTVAYTVQIASDEQFQSVVWSGPSAGPAASVPPGVLLENTRYWWRVTATSQGGSTVSPSFTFTTRAFADGNLDGVINFTDLNNTLSRFGQPLP